jgi:hypothetical protein
MASYQFMELPSAERNKNVKVKVWKIKNNKPQYMGEQHHHTASWRGANAIAQEIIAEEEGYSFDGYSINRKDIRLFKITSGEV